MIMNSWKNKKHYLLSNNHQYHHADCVDCGLWRHYAHHSTGGNKIVWNQHWRDKRHYRKTFQKAGIPFMIAMAIAIILIRMTDFSIMLDYQCYLSLTMWLLILRVMAMKTVNKN